MNNYSVTFNNFINFIYNTGNIKNIDFQRMSEIIDDYINALSLDDYKNILNDIGVIPESISHDSTEEKLFSKATDSVLSRAFSELNIKSRVLDTRANSADVIAKSFHGYTFVADAKAFRLSRTAKNQKDFKVKSMNDWKGNENDYAVLVCPYYQYPKTRSQIYSQALDVNVCLLSWEHLLFLIDNNIKESKQLSLVNVWNASSIIGKSGLDYKNRNLCFLSAVNNIICETASLSLDILTQTLKKVRTQIIKRGIREIDFWKNEIEEIKQYSKEKAIDELIAAKKLHEKINQINKYINKLR